MVLRKPGKSDYTVAKAYQPVALLNCMSKILSRCVADVLVYEAEQHSLLADFQFGGRPGRQRSDSIHMVTKLIKDEWRSHEVTSVLFLDIKSAFPAATPDRLFHNMRMRGILAVIVDWLAEKLRGRRTILTFDDFVSELYAIDSGIDQGCPLSVVLYVFYTSDLLDSGDKKRKVTPVGSMDNVAVVVVAATMDLAHGKLCWYMMCDGGGQTWSEEQNSTYSVDKSAVMNCNCRNKNVGPGLMLGEEVVPATDCHPFLGALIDCQLRFHQQVARAVAKGSQWVTVIKRMAKSRHGLSMEVVRRLYLTVAVPSMMYAADTFLTLLWKVPGKKNTKGSVGAIRKLAAVQRQALLPMAGAMRSMATDVLEVHANLLPFHLLVDKLCFQATAHLCTLPRTHPLSPHITRASSQYVKSHRPALHELFGVYGQWVSPKTMEKIKLVRHDPRWRPSHTVEKAANKDDAKESNGEWARKYGIRIYTDGSAVDGGVSGERPIDQEVCPAECPADSPADKRRGAMAPSHRSVTVTWPAHCVTRSRHPAFLCTR